MTKFYVIKIPQQNHFNLFQCINELPFSTPAYGLRTDALRSLTKENTRHDEWLLIAFFNSLPTFQEFLDEGKKEEAALQIQSIQYYRWRAPMHDITDTLLVDGMIDLQPIRDRLPKPTVSYHYAANPFLLRHLVRTEVAQELPMNPVALLEYPPAQNNIWPLAFDLTPVSRHSLFVCVPILLGNLYKSQIYRKSDFDGWAQSYLGDILRDPNTGAEVDMTKVFVCSGNHLVEMCGFEPLEELMAES